jgi:hypothetical protein
MNHRHFVARLRKRLCTRHNTPIRRSVYFDGGTCSFGCVSLNTVRETWLRQVERERPFYGKYGRKP